MAKVYAEQKPFALGVDWVPIDPWNKNGSRDPAGTAAQYLNGNLSILNEKLDHLDPSNTSAILVQKAAQTEAALAAANNALTASQAAGEIFAQAQPLLTKLENIEQRMQRLEEKVETKSSACSIL
eukprot:SAG31_NODE_1027_length_10273_cov_50.715746_4_plen_125_part_00